MKKTILILIVIVTIVSGCKKTKYSYIKLLGHYKLSEYTVDGVDSLNIYKDSLGMDYFFYFDDQKDHYNCEISGTRNDGKETMLFWWWTSNDKNNGIFVVASFSKIINTGIGPYGNKKQPVWVFLNVTNKEIEMKTTYNGKEYTVDFRKL